MKMEKQQQHFTTLRGWSGAKRSVDTQLTKPTRHNMAPRGGKRACSLGVHAETFIEGKVWGWGVGVGVGLGFVRDVAELVYSSNRPSRMLSKEKGTNLKPCPV